MPTRHLHKDIASRLPLDLMTCDQWITWIAGQPDSTGKFEKFPIGKDGTGSAWQKQHQWFSFKDAIANAQKNHRSGVGVVLPAKLSDGNYLVALDFDGVDISSQESNLRYDEIQQTSELCSKLQRSRTSNDFNRFQCFFLLNF
jgi:primase-polymerase (primpol)-like protein